MICIQNVKYGVSLCCFIALAACQPKESQSDERRPEQAAHAAAKAVKPAPAGNALIIPGKRAGQVFINEPAEDIAKRLGKPDSGDAAMGKALAIWYSKKPAAGGQPVYVTSIFYATDMGAAHAVPRAKQIRVTSPFFVTAGGMHTGSEIQEISREYPGLKKTAQYDAAVKGEKTAFYDDAALGIAFDVDSRGRCIAITVHEPGHEGAGSYLPMQPGFERLQ